MFSQRRTPTPSRPDWITIGVAIATVAAILAGASVTGLVLVSQAQPQTVADDFPKAARIGVFIYGVVSLFAFGATLVNALAPIFDPNDSIRLQHVRSAAKFFLFQGLMIVGFAILVIATFAFPVGGTSQGDSASSTAPLQTGESTVRNENTQDEHCPASGHD